MALIISSSHVLPQVSQGLCPIPPWRCPTFLIFQATWLPWDLSSLLDSRKVVQVCRLFSFYIVVGRRAAVFPFFYISLEFLNIFPLTYIFLSVISCLLPECRFFWELWLCFVYNYFIIFSNSTWYMLGAQYVCEMNEWCSDHVKEYSGNLCWN